MSIVRLISHLENLCPLSVEFRQALERVVVPVTLPKHYMLLEPPRIAEHAYFVVRGLLMCYTYQDSKKCVEGFWTSEQILVSLRSFFEQVPATEFIQLLDESDLLCISCADAMRLLETFPEAQCIYRKVLNHYYEESRARARELASIPASVRYSRFIRHIPKVEQHLSQELIASYLGITPQSLSRIKRYKK